MNPKITKEEFYNIKTKLKNEFEIVANKIENMNISDLSEEEQIEILQNLLKTYNTYIQELISYDLSDIPSEEWEGIKIISFDFLDFSKTQANIDFNVVEISCKEGINFKNCKLSNFNNLYDTPMFEECFDQEVIDNNPKYFLSSLFNKEFKDKFAKRIITIDDLLKLTEEQIKELETKEYKRSLTYDTSIEDNWKYRNLLDAITISQFIKLYNEDPVFTSDIATIYTTIGSYYIQMDYPYLFSGEIDIEELKEKIDEIFEKTAKNHYSGRFINKNFSQDFISRHPTLFPNKENLSPELFEKLTEKELTIEDIINHYEELSDLDISVFLKRDYEIDSIKEMLGSSFVPLIIKYPNIFKNRKELITDSSILYKLRGLLERELITQSANIEDIFINCLLKINLGEELTFSPNATPDIYEETRYPDWVKEIGYYASSISHIEDNSLNYISSKTEIIDPVLKNFFDIMGLKNIKQMDNNNYFFNADVFGYLSSALKRMPFNPVNSYEEFEEKLITLIYKSEEPNAYRVIDTLKWMPEASPFRQKNRGLFISNDAPEELKRIFYTKNISIKALLQNTEWIPYLKDIDLIKLNVQFPINIINSNIKGENILPPQPSNFVEIFLKDNSTEELIEFLSGYYPYLRNNRLEFVIDIADTSAESLKSQFASELANCIIKNNFIEISSDSPKDFKTRFPKLFLPDDAPETLKSYFYKRYLTIENIQEHPEWLAYLKNVDPRLIKNLPNEIGAINSEFGPNQLVQIIKLNEIYVEKFGLDKYLEFLFPYIKTLRNQSLRNFAIDLKDPSKESIELQIEKIIHNCIIEKRAPFDHNLPTQFKENYPDIFLPDNAPEELKKAYYNRQLKFEDIRLNPLYKEYIKDVDLVTAFSGDVFTTTTNDIYPQVRLSIPRVLKFISKEQLLELITSYGMYFTQLRIRPEFLEEDDFDKLKQKIEDEIISILTTSEKRPFYIAYQENAPEFIKKRLPDFFLDDNAPIELKNYYYQVNSNYQISLALIGKHPEWIPFLKDKNLWTALEKINNFKKSNIEFLQLFGQDTALKYAVNRNETIKVMIETNKVDTMYNWWLKTGKKFIPDYVVMQNLKIEDIDKFLSHGKEWSQLMRNKRFALTKEGRISLVKLAYCFGVFDGDTQGYKKLESFLNDIPRKLNEYDMKIILEMEETIKEENENKLTIGKEEYQQLRATLEKEGVKINGESIFQELYRKNDDGTYTLTINNQMYPKSRELLRSFMEKNNLSLVISADKAHNLFGGFTVQYDRDFREFLLKNLEELINNPEYVKYISAIQQQFQEIKTVNSNRVLTPELAVSYVQENKYINVNTGNDELAHVSGIAGYSQNDFETLQKIYEYGKARVTSSIPRISGENEKFSYEILRLTDPLAIAIGTLTDCCQELHNAAELCMEHSMVDKNGRLFLIKDKEGNFVSQSWVWRNGNVLCFDNVEIPEKQLLKSGMDRNLIGTGARNELTDEVLAIYKKAADELIEEDHRVFKALLEEGKITEEQYEKYRLRKVTVGEGYNDIKASIIASFERDQEKLARPLPFVPPVELRNGLYVNDSTVQYVLSDNQERSQYVDTTLPVHYDNFKVLDKNNITKNDIFLLEKLEISHGRYTYQLNTAVNDISSSEVIMDEIGSNYGVDPNTTKIIINPNFAIVYSETQDEISIVDLITNGTMLNESPQKDKIYLQLKLAILQLVSTNKTINTESYLYTKEQKIIEEIMNISEEQLNQERGISNGI